MVAGRVTLAGLLWLLAAAMVPSERADADSPARVVVAGPASGRFATALPAMVDGARRAGPTGLLQVDSVDDGCDAGRAEGAARAIAAQKPDLVIGHPCPAAAIAAARVYAEANVVFIALGVRHPDLTAKRAGPTVFRLAGRDDRQGVAVAEALVALSPSGRIAIVQDRTAYARGLTEAVVAELAARNVPKPAIVPIVAGRRDYDAELAKLKPAPPEAIFFAGYPSEAAVILSGLAKAGIEAATIASDANATDEFARVVATRSASGSRPVKVMVPAEGSGGADPKVLEDAALQAVVAWRRAGSPRTAAEVSRLTVDHAKEAVSFDDKGDARIASFTAVALVAGRWAENAGAGR